MERKISEIISKNVITLDNGQIVGYVLNACFNQNLTSLVGFVVADDESESENFLACKDIKIYGEDSIFVNDASVLSFSLESSNNPVGKKVYDENGMVLGQVKDVVLMGNKVQDFVLNTCQLPVKNISACGINCLFFGKKFKKKCQKNAKKVENNLNNLPKVQIESTISSAKISNKLGNIKIESPQKVILTPSNLLNKIATSDIIGLNNEIIIKKGQKIDKNKIDKAKKHGKLNLLIINSK